MRSAVVHRPELNQTGLLGSTEAMCVWEMAELTWCAVTFVLTERRRTLKSKVYFRVFPVEGAVASV